MSFRFIRRLLTGTINRVSSKHSSWWRRLEDVFRPRLQKTSSTHIHNVLIKTNIFALLMRLQDVFKTLWSRPVYSSWPFFFKTSSQSVFKTSCKNVSRHLQDVFKTSSRHLQDVLPKTYQDIFKTSLRGLAKTSSRRQTSQKFMVSVENLS